MLAVVAEMAAHGREQEQVVTNWLDGRGHLDESLVTVPWWPWGLETPEALRRLMAVMVQGGDAADAR